MKKVIDPDDFNFRKFLDAVIINLAWQGTKKNAALCTGRLHYTTAKRILI